MTGERKKESADKNIKAGQATKAVKATQTDQTIKIETTRFGAMEFKDESVITILGGVIGFPALTRYVLIQRTTDAPFYWLQSLDDPTLALVLVNPVLFKEDYNPRLPDGLQEELKASEGEITLFAIVTIPVGRPQDMTANLLGPLAINPKSRLARQLVLDDSLYTHRQPIIPSTP